MSIIFYEYEHCKEIIDKGVTKITQKDLNYLAMYWEYEGKCVSTIRKNIEVFCLKNDKNFNLIQSAKMINRAITHAKNNRLRFPAPISVTESELASLEQVNDYNKQKFLFSMLVCAKFFKQHPSRKKPKKNKYENVLFSNSSFRDIQEVAGTRFTKKQWILMKHEFTLSALISPTIMGSNCWSIGFWNENSTPTILIDDYRNPIAYYQERCGERVIRCEKCGAMIARKSNRHTMCAKCWTVKHNELEKQRYEKMKYFGV